MSVVSVAEVGFALVIFGFMLAFVAIILLAIRSSGGGKTRGGGVLLIGPIPIIFGTDRESAKVLIVLAIILVLIVLAFMFLWPFLVIR